ncbi:glycosyltransferase family 2 protein [Pseudolabrys sp. FHR47]|uniref:glycosyltransferase family 2 protein n=1 Tax=Pseudolabrys sp. FHR47 TaxID=2562284 RepID=UPI0010BE9AB2|nr:glycosyltransferase [Pseudolabrys sp. FHR47]
MLDATIIIPVFNRQALCERALHSVVVQNVANTEIIVVDDCSQPAFTLPSSLSGHGIRVIRHEKNHGAAAARNTGIEAAQGEWLLFLDSDDYWLTDTLAPRLTMAQQNYATNRSALTAFVAGFVLENKSIGRHDTRIPRASDDPLDFASGCWFSPGSTLLLRREVFAKIGPYDTALARLEDLDWFLRFALAGGRLERWPNVAAIIELGGKPRRDTLEQAAHRLLTKYATTGSPNRLTAPFIRRLKAYLDVERASIAAANRDWLATAFYFVRSWLRVPRTTLHLKRFWD